MFQLLWLAVSLVEARTEWVQSIPLETHLAQPGVLQTLPTWIQLIESAQKSIDIEQMYIDIKSGSSGERLLAALERAGKRGVKIRVLVSKKMAGNDPTTRERLLKIPELEWRTVDYGSKTGGIQHSKFWIVDKNRTYVGSANFDWRALEHIHEMGITSDEPSLAQAMARIFEVDWNLDARAKTTRKRDPKIQFPEGIELVASPPSTLPPGIHYSLDRLISLIRSSKKTIQIQLLDYLPQGLCPGDSPSTAAHRSSCYWGEIDQELRLAASRGVKINMLLSHWNTDAKEIHYLKSLILVPGIRIRIATVPEAKDGFIPYARVIHSKYALFDSSSIWVGTSNWSQGYFLQTRGIELVLKLPNLIEPANAIFENIWNQKWSTDLNPESQFPPPRKGE
jgi:phosphatidylserine/phosphatidylglycerophosphate/cardiolipin synthase-like enzyme